MSNNIKIRLETHEKLKAYIIDQLESFFNEPKDKPYTKEEMLRALKAILEDIKGDDK